MIIITRVCFQNIFLNMCLGCIKHDWNQQPAVRWWHIPFQREFKDVKSQVFVVKHLCYLGLFQHRVTPNPSSFSLWNLPFVPHWCVAIYGKQPSHLSQPEVKVASPPDPPLSLPAPLLVHPSSWGRNLAPKNPTWLAGTAPRNGSCCGNIICKDLLN